MASSQTTIAAASSLWPPRSGGLDDPRSAAADGPDQKELAAVAWKWLDLAVIGVATGLLLTSELFNTAVERLCDFVQPDYDERIGAVKDVAAAAAGTGMVAWFAVVAIEAVRLILQLR